jgi:hypothetical protein
MYVSDLTDGGEERVHILASIELAEADAHGAFGKSPDGPGLLQHLLVGCILRYASRQDQRGKRDDGRCGREHVVIVDLLVAFAPSSRWMLKLMVLES